MISSSCVTYSMQLKKMRNTISYPRNRSVQGNMLACIGAPIWRHCWFFFKQNYLYKISMFWFRDLPFFQRNTLNRPERDCEKMHGINHCVLLHDGCLDCYWEFTYDIFSKSVSVFLVCTSCFPKQRSLLAEQKYRLFSLSPFFSMSSLMLLNHLEPMTHKDWKKIW